jgi:hypothetical protein
MTHPLLLFFFMLGMQKAWMNSVDTKNRESLDDGVFGLALGFCVFWSWCYVFGSPKEKLLRCSWGVREELFSKGSLK